MKHSSNFTITAHTGCMGTQMNSLESINKAAEYKADITEFDLNFKSDRSPVLSHNPPVGNEVTLDEAFNLLSGYPQIKINIDVKNDANLGIIYPLAKKYALENRIFLTGVDSRFIESVKRDANEIPYYFNFIPNKIKLLSEKYTDDIVKTVKESGAVGLNTNFRFVSKRLIKALHKNGLSVSLWTANTVRQMKKAMSYNPDNITTKDVKTLKELIKKR